MRELLRGLAKAEMERMGVAHVNLYLSKNWRNVVRDYFEREKKGKKK